MMVLYWCYISAIPVAILVLYWCYTGALLVAIPVCTESYPRPRDCYRTFLPLCSNGFVPLELQSRSVNQCSLVRYIDPSILIEPIYIYIVYMYRINIRNFADSAVYNINDYVSQCPELAWAIDDISISIRTDLDKRCLERRRKNLFWISCL